MATIKNATLEVNADNHQAWFGATGARDNADAHSGTWSYLVTSTDAFGSAVELDNFPYFGGITAGNSYDFWVWYKEATATMPTVEWRIRWHQNDGTPIGDAIVVSLPRATTWTEVTDTLVAPALAARVSWTFFFSVATPGPAFRFDDLLVEDTGPDEITGTAAGALGVLAGTVTGRRATFGTASGSLGALVGTMATQLLSGNIVGDRNIGNGGLITDDGGTYRLKQTAKISVSRLELTFGNWSCAVDGVGDVAGSNAYTIGACYVETGGALTQVLFDGNGSISLAPGAHTNGYATVSIAIGTDYYIRTYVTPDTVGGSYPRLKISALDFPGEVSRKSANHANEVGTTNLTDFSEVFGPNVTTGTHTGGTQRAVAVVGDSIANGSGDDLASTARVGFLYRALSGKRAFVLMALPGESGQRYITTQGTFRRKHIGPAADYAICEYGINDLQGSLTLAQCKAALISIWSDIKAKKSGVKVIQTTITPKSATTDDWATVENQTPDGTVHPVRPTLNDWIRAGAPMVGGVGVTPGTSGEIVAGHVNHPLFTYFEITDLVESARNSGLWKAAHTADGIHPNATGHAAMVAGVDLLVLGGSITGTAAGLLGGLTGTATGVRTVTGTASGVLGGLSGSAIGVRSVLAAATGALGALSGIASGFPGFVGVATGLLGELTGVAVGTGRTIPGSWLKLASIVAEARDMLREDRAREPLACPSDGEPLERDSDGRLHCPFDGWRSAR